MKKSIQSGALILVIVTAFSFSISARDLREKRELVIQICENYRERIGSNINLENERERIQNFGVDADFSAGAKADNGTLLIASAKLDRKPQYCQLEATSGRITFVR